MIQRTWSKAIAVVLCGALGVLLAPGCKNPVADYPCEPGTTVWMCTIEVSVSCACGGPPGWKQEIDWPCASNAFQAGNDAERLVSARNNGATVRNLGCTDTGSRYMQSVQPTIRPQGGPSCEASLDDNECVACAKASCCSEYEACGADPICQCWVACKAGGNADLVCAAAENCGPLDAVSTTTGTCLLANCPACSSGGSESACYCDSGG